jgi:hypothetical protein
MAITATSSGSTPRELIPTGNYLARCYKMIHIGTVEEVILGEKKIMNKVRIGWELPTEQRVFSEEKGLQPLVIDKEYTLSLHEKSALRATLKSWRGKDFTEDEAKAFDITKLLGVPCMINIIHKPSKKDPSRSFEEIAGITAVPKGFNIPAQINPTFVLDYDNFDTDKFNTLPDFIKLKMQTSVEYLSMQNPSHRDMPSQEQIEDVENEIPF